MSMSRVVVSWSGGKDSCLACYKAILEGHKISYLVNFFNKNDEKTFHGIDSQLIHIQSQAVGIPLIQRGVTWNTYEQARAVILHRIKR